MTDFFSDLERHLLDAARRERRARPPIGAIVAAVAVVTAVLVVARTWPALEEREAGVQEPTPAPTSPTGCGEPTDGAPPARWSNTLAVLARPASEAEREFAQRLPAELAEQGAYRNHARLARVVDGREYWLVPVKNVMLGGECPGSGQDVRGVCLYIVEHRNGTLQNCSMPAGVRTGLEWMARPVKGGREIVGVMPNDVATLRMNDPALGTKTFDVVGNVVAGRLRVRGGDALDNAQWSYLDAAGREISP